MRSKNRDGDIRVIGKHTLVTAKGCPNCTTIDGVVYNCGCQGEWNPKLKKMRKNGHGKQGESLLKK